MVDAQMRLLDHFGIERLHAAVGASTGGMACLSLATRYPQRVDRVVPIASGLQTTPLQRVQNFEQIVAIQSDPDFRAGRYAPGAGPRRGLALARMISHKLFVSLRDMEQRSTAAIEPVEEANGWYGVRHPLESYMLHQGQKLPRRFDANSYLRILDAWQSFDLLREGGASDFAELFARCRHQRYLQFTIDSDMCFAPEEQLRLELALEEAGIENVRVTVHSHQGARLVPDRAAPLRAAVEVLLGIGVARRRATAASRSPLRRSLAVPLRIAVTRNRTVGSCREAADDQLRRVGGREAAGARTGGRPQSGRGSGARLHCCRSR